MSEQFDQRQYTITLLNLLNRAVELNIAQGIYDIENIKLTLEDLKDLVREDIMSFRENIPK